MATSKLIIWDHDGTLCQSTNLAYESLRYAGQASAQNMGFEPIRLVNEWDYIIAKLTGTSDKRVAKECCYILGIYEKDKQLEFEQQFYKNRALWIKKMKGSGEYIYDTYYPDAEQLVLDLNKVDSHQIFSTGNPTNVMEHRIAPHMRKYFEDKQGKLLGAFGEEGLMRTDILKLAVDRSESIFEDFSKEVGSDGFITNVFYIADSYNDFVAAIRLRLRIIWIPSRSLQVLKDTMAKEHIELLADIFRDHVRITNSLQSESVRKFLDI